MPEKKLNRTITHALTCEELEDKYIYYIPGSQQQMGVVLNAVGKLFGVISKCHFIPIGSLPETQKDDAGKSVASALENWGDVVRYNEHSLYSTSTHLVSHDYTPSIAGYDNAQKFISSQILLPPAILTGTSQIIGAYQSYDHMQSTTSRANAVLPSFLFGASNVNGKYGLVPPIAPYANGTLSDIFIGTSLATGGYNHVPPSTSYANAASSNVLIETSQINGRFDPMQPNAPLFSHDCSNDACHDNFEFHDEQKIAAPEDINPFSDTFGYPFWGTLDGVYSGPPNHFNMEFGTSNDIPDQLIPDPDFSIDEYFGPDERLKKDISNVQFRKWGKMIFVLRFSCRMKMKKPGRVQRRLKSN